MTLRYAEITPDGRLENEVELDDRICDCCGTSAAKVGDETIVVYRDRSDEEVRDISYVRLRDGRATRPQSVSDDRWKIDGCPVQGPAIASDGERALVAWFTAAGDSPVVNAAFLNSTGESFGRATRVDLGNTVGRVDAAMLDSDTAFVTWIEGGEPARVVGRIVRPNGSVGPPIRIAETSGQRPSGFPRIAAQNKTVWIAWTDVLGEDSRVRTAKIDFSGSL
jgi:hypothetical protein